MAASKKVQLPQDFLAGPVPNLTRSDVNFRKGGIPEYEGCWAVILDGALTGEECDQLVAAAEATTDGKWERAMVNVGGGMQRMYEDVRKCGRIILDDHEIAAKIWARVEASVPEIHRLKSWGSVTGHGPVKRGEVWKVRRLNERMRFLKYTGGEYFKAHCDGTYETPDGIERSYFTLHLYLSDADGEEPLKGGETTFYGYNMKRRIDVSPKKGRVLLFQHQDLMHSGEDVISGTKYTMRTDIMYSKEEEVIEI